MGFIFGFLAGLALGYGLATLISKSADSGLSEMASEARSQQRV
jgi:hypothetical protein